MRGVYYNLWLWYHNWGRGTQLWECMSIPVHAGFQERQCFRLMGCDTSVIDTWHYCFIRLMLSEDLASVNLWHEIYMCVCVECDYWWPCYWWSCWYEMMLLLLIMSLRWDDVDFNNVIEMMFMLIMSLTWNDVDVDNVIEMMMMLIMSLTKNFSPLILSLALSS